MRAALLLAVMLAAGCTSASGPLQLLEDVSKIASSAAQGENVTSILNVPPGIYDYSAVNTGKTWALVFKHQGIVYSQSSSAEVKVEPSDLLEKAGRKKVTAALNGTQVVIRAG